MTLLHPNFVGIGVPKAATTWLHAQLLAHPDAFVPPDRKELYFFDKNYERGPAWYLEFFRTGSAQKAPAAVGEITPSYLFSSSALGRIEAFGIRQVIIMLRNPIDRAYSHYNHLKRFEGRLGSFEDMVSAADPRIVGYSLYAHGIEECFERFGRENVLILLHENVSRDPRGVLQEVGKFLGIDPARFETSATNQSVNAGFVPKYPLLVRLLYRVNYIMRRLGLDFLVERLKGAGATQLLGILGRKPEKLQPSVRQDLVAVFSGDVARVRQLCRWTDVPWPDFR